MNKISKLCNSDKIVETFVYDLNNKKIKNVNIRLFNEILKLLNTRKEKNITYYLKIFTYSKLYKPNLFTYSIILTSIYKYNYLVWKKGLFLLNHMIKQNVIPNKFCINPVISALSKNKKVLLKDILDIINIFKKINFSPCEFTLSTLFKCIKKMEIEHRKTYAKKWFIEYSPNLKMNKFIIYELNNIFLKVELDKLLLNHKNKTLSEIDKKSSNVFTPSFMKEKINTISNSDEEIENEIILIKKNEKYKEKNKFNKRRSSYSCNIIREPFGPSIENFKNINGIRVIPRIFSA